MSAMVISLTWEGTRKLLMRFLSAVKWPVALVITTFFISPKFWNFWRNASPDETLILNYVRELKWPVLIFTVFMMTRKYIPSLISRAEEITAWKMKFKFKSQDQPVDTDDIEKLPDSNKPAEEPSDGGFKELERQMNSPEVESEFERIWQNIYGSQLMIMKRLFDHVPEGLDEGNLADLYRAHLKSAPNPYPSFSHLVQFLLDSIMVLYDVNDSKYKITNAGVYFLRYLQKTNNYNIMPMG